ncbi:hypothetical protein [Pseudomonas sp. SO81]|uniref:hypothetical protein n=1 Tax=Pseudomonas sp. SO81 TaxID=2983246 RepID=UPI0025A37CFB|nr:hypothetical protein [Pseudomonas sp. SO81]
MLAGQAAQSISTFLTGLLIARWGGQAELGYYAVAYSFCFLTVCISDALLATPYTYFYSSAPARRSSMLMAAYFGIFGLSIVLGLSVPVLFLSGVQSLESVVVSLPFALLAIAFREMFKRHLHVAGKLTVAFCYDLLSSGLQVVLVFVLGFTGYLSAATAYIAITVATIFSISLFFRRFRVEFRVGWGQEVRYWLCQYFQYGRWLIMGTACHVAGVQLYPWLALAKGGAAGAGVFAASMALANLLNPLLIGLTNYFRPRFMERYQVMVPKALSRYAGKVALLFMGPAVVFVSLVWLQGGALLALFYGDGYRVGEASLFYLALGGLFIALAAPLQLALLAARIPVTNLLYHAVSLLLIVLTSFLSWSVLSSDGLSHIYAGVNFAGFLMLICFFGVRVARR